VNNRNYLAGIVHYPAGKYKAVVGQAMSCDPDRDELNCKWNSQEWTAELEDSMFSIMFRGDSSTSGRLYDALMR
jgi:hypothetical protein